MVLFHGYPPSAVSAVVEAEARLARRSIESLFTERLAGKASYHHQSALRWTLTEALPLSLQFMSSGEGQTRRGGGATASRQLGAAATAKVATEMHQALVVTFGADSSELVDLQVRG